jgi:hypothetical protein
LSSTIAARRSSTRRVFRESLTGRNGDPKLNPAEFAEKWGNSKLKERSGYQEHFIDLCYVVGHQTPAAVDPSGASFCFERGTQKIEGGQG